VGDEPFFAVPWAGWASVLIVVAGAIITDIGHPWIGGAVAASGVFLTWRVAFKMRNE
jgi:hypothetical protein